MTYVLLASVRIVASVCVVCAQARVNRCTNQNKLSEHSCDCFEYNRIYTKQKNDTRCAEVTIFFVREDTVVVFP